MEASTILAAMEILWSTIFLMNLSEISWRNHSRWIRNHKKKAVSQKITMIFSGKSCETAFYYSFSILSCVIATTLMQDFIIFTNSSGGSGWGLHVGIGNGKKKGTSFCTVFIGRISGAVYLRTANRWKGLWIYKKGAEVWKRQEKRKGTAGIRKQIR